MPNYSATAALQRRNHVLPVDLWIKLKALRPLAFDDREPGRSTAEYLLAHAYDPDNHIRQFDRSDRACIAIVAKEPTRFSRTLTIAHTSYPDGIRLHQNRGGRPVRHLRYLEK